MFMKLAAWLEANSVKRVNFARAIGVSPGAVTQFCNQDGAWISRETAQMILRETNGAGTPNDFLGVAGGDAALKGNSVADSVSAAIHAFKSGEIVVVADDDDREGEGDLFVAASLA